MKINVFKSIMVLKNANNLVLNEKCYVQIKYVIQYKRQNMISTTT